MITVVGSINLDLVAATARLPGPGETVTGATFARHPGGKGANQALAARRLGAEVRLVGRVGADPFATEALALLRDGGVELDAVETDDAALTGVAVIAVAADGENLIVVAPGANAMLTPERLPRTGGALLCQLELPLETVARAVAEADGFVCLNLAPAADLPQATLDRADVLVVNETEAAFYGERLHRGAGLVAITLGARGAELFRGGERIAAAAPPPVKAVDAVGAGDAFVGALAVALLEGQSPRAALRFACTAGAQPSLPTRSEVEARLASAPEEFT